MNRSGSQHLEHEIGDRLTAWHLDLVRHAGWDHHDIARAGGLTDDRTSARARRIGHDLSAIPLPWLHELRSFHAPATHDHRSPGLNDEDVRHLFVELRATAHIAAKQEHCEHGIAAERSPRYLAAWLACRPGRERVRELAEIDSAQMRDRS